MMNGKLESGKLRIIQLTIDQLCIKTKAVIASAEKQ